LICIHPCMHRNETYDIIHQSICISDPIKNQTKARKKKTKIKGGIISQETEQVKRKTLITFHSGF
jgi:hypothetical protein